MSINSAMLAGVSGLVANSSALAAISDNIANVNTIGYKRSQVDFANIVTSQSQTGRYSAGGVQGQARTYVSQQGLVQSTNSSTDLAVSGDGFFVVSSKSGTLSASDPRMFTRAGSFTVDSSGYLVNKAGLYLQGWEVSKDGTYNINPSDVNALKAINVKNLGAAVQKTTEINLSANIDKTGVVSADEAAYVRNTNTSMADYAADPATGTKPDFVMEMNVVDSAGVTHKVAMSFLKSDGAANEWHAEIYAVPAAEVTGTTRPGQLASGLVKFNQDGSIDLDNSTLFGAAGADPTLTLGGSSATTGVRWASGVGVEGQAIDFNLKSLTQYGDTSTVNSVTTNGAGVGQVVGVQVSADGIVSAVYSNSQIRAIAKVAVATFPDPNALTQVSGNAYQASLSAGDMTLKEAGVGGAGKISPSSLEASTVDLSAEFTGLITTQKAYSASSKIITTADQMLEELLNVKR